MPTPDLAGVPSFADYEMFKRTFNQTVQKLNNFMVQLDSMNVVSLTADHIDTGTLLAQLVTVMSNLNGGAYIRIDGNGLVINDGTKDVFVADINGDVTATSITVQSASGYPKIVLNPTGNLVGAYLDADSYVAIEPDRIGGNPTFSFIDNGNYGAGLAYVNAVGILFQTFIGSLTLNTATDINLNATGIVAVPSWSQLYSDGEMQSLATALNNLASAISGKATLGSSTGSAGSHNHGIPDGTVLVTDTGTVTWSSVGNHSHTQT